MSLGSGDYWSIFIFLAVLCIIYKVIIGGGQGLLGLNHPSQFGVAVLWGIILILAI